MPAKHHCEQKAGLVCVTANAPTVEGMKEEIGMAAAGGADLVELRLDALAPPAVAPFFSPPPPLPLLVTCRPSWEGGGYCGPEEARLDILSQAFFLGARFVDIELKASDGMRLALKQCRDQAKGSALVFSWHDFSGTPSKEKLLAIYRAMRDGGADIGKIVATARSQRDMTRLLTLLETAAKDFFPLSVFSMGDPGRISRLLTVLWGGAMTYACLDEAHAAAPGQLTLAAMKRQLAFWRAE